MTAGTAGEAGGEGAPLTPEAARQRLSSAAAGEAEETRVFLLASRQDDDWPIERLKMTDDLAAQFVDVVKRVAREHGEDQLVAYSAGRVVLDGETAVLPTSSVPSSAVCYPPWRVRSHGSETSAPMATSLASSGSTLSRCVMPTQVGCMPSASSR